MPKLPSGQIAKGTKCFPPSTCRFSRGAAGVSQKAEQGKQDKERPPEVVSSDHHGSGGHSEEVFHLHCLPLHPEDRRELAA